MKPQRKSGGDKAAGFAVFAAAGPVRRVVGVRVLRGVAGLDIGGAAASRDPSPASPSARLTRDETCPRRRAWSLDLSVRKDGSLEIKFRSKKLREEDPEDGSAAKADTRQSSQDMKKFGGPNRIRQKCRLRQCEVRARKMLRVKDEELGAGGRGRGLQRKGAGSLLRSPSLTATSPSSVTVSVLTPACEEEREEDSEEEREDSEDSEHEEEEREQQQARLRLSQMERQFLELEEIISTAKKQLVQQDEEVAEGDGDDTDLQIFCVSVDEVCGCPLVKDVFQATGDFCRVSKRKCNKHYCWEKLRRAEIDLERVRVWYKLDELFEQERNLRTAMTNRAGLLALMLHQTIQHDPVTTDLRSTRDR
ncbi:hypothetical protein CRUP_007385 [Coryphaenoides rupestris]|nr:hypothetical protein CRUP_007385 [Coryphaenoides rupestris]